MSFPVFRTDLSPQCLATLNSNLLPLANACKQQSVPSMANLAANAQTILTGACTTACSTAVSSFAAASRTTCANQLIFQGDPSATALSLASQFAILTSVGCVKDSKKSFCVIEQFATLKAANVNPESPNIFYELVSYAQRNTTFACSSCVKNQLETAKTLTTLDAAWKSSIDTVVLDQSVICPVPPPSVNWKIVNVGSLKVISLNTDTTLWGIQISNKLKFCNAKSGSCQEVNGGYGNLIQVSSVATVAGAGVVCGLNSNNEVFCAGYSSATDMKKTCFHKSSFYFDQLQ